MLYEPYRRPKPNSLRYGVNFRPRPSVERPAATPENLAKIKILFRTSDTLILWGICYDMRAECGQQPKDISEEWRGDWIYLGQPGWFGSMSREEIDATKAFLAERADEIPSGPNEWCRLEGR